MSNFHLSTFRKKDSSFGSFIAIVTSPETFGPEEAGWLSMPHNSDGPLGYVFEFNRQ